MKRRQKPRNKVITQLDTIKSVRRMISKPTQVHHTKKEKHKWDWEDDLDDDINDSDHINAQSHKSGDYE